MKTKMKMALVVLTGVALITATACSGKKKQEVKVEKEEAPIVETQLASEETVQLTSEYTATVEAFKTNSISATGMNRIKRIMVDVGSHVHAGQALVALDDVNIAQQQIAMAAQRRDLNRARELVRIGGGTQQAVDQLQAQYDANARALRTMQENTVLTSPISGVVTTRNYNNGDLPSGLPILVIEQQQPLKVVVDVNETDLPKIKKGMGVNVTFDTYEGENFGGQVYLIHPTIDPTSRTFKVEVTINNRGDKVHSGMFGRVTFNFGSSRNVVISDKAVQKQPGSGVRYVYTAEDNGTVKFREITLGRRLDNRWEVLSGLTPGMKVVTAGQSKLSNGTKVRMK
jgi:hypothetical protein